MSGSDFVIVVLVVLVAAGLFYFIKARRTCPKCEAPGLRTTGLSKMYDQGRAQQIKYQCTYCGFKEWKVGVGGDLDDEQANTWRQLSNQIGAEFIQKKQEGGFFKPREGCKVRARVKEWTITLYDTKEIYTTQHSATTVHGTNMDAPYVTKDEFAFMIYPKGMLSELGKLFGGQDAEVGYPEFDRDFIIKCTDEAKVRALFANSRIRQLIQAQPGFHRFGADSYYGVRPELYFRFQSDVAVITDVGRLKSLFELFGETLNQLVAIGSASEENPNVKL